jgi:hypothetical protein
MSGLPKGTIAELPWVLLSVLHKDFHACNTHEKYLIRTVQDTALAENSQQKVVLVGASNLDRFSCH